VYKLTETLACGCVQSPVTMASCDGDSDSSHVTGSCSPSDSVHDVPRARQHRRPHLSTSLFPAGSADVADSVQPLRTAEERRSTAVVVPSPLTAWCPTPFVVDRMRNAATSILPELLGSDAYCRLAAAAAASIAGIYWGRRSDEKPGVDLMLSWPTVAAAAASFSLPTMTPSYPSTADNPMSLLSNSVLDGSSWLGMTRQALQTDETRAGGKVAVTPDSSGSPSSVDDLPLDLSPVAKRARVTSPLTSDVADDDCSV